MGPPRARVELALTPHKGDVLATKLPGLGFIKKGCAQICIRGVVNLRSTGLRTALVEAKP